MTSPSALPASKSSTQQAGAYAPEDAPQVGDVAAAVPATESAVGFTPGPWWFDKMHGLIYAGEQLVAEPYGDDIRGPHPNARLIAAAPSLYEALTAVCGYLLNAQIDIETGAKRATAVNTIQGGLKIARAALKLARGE